jgi:hypothetical protein
MYYKTIEELCEILLAISERRLIKNYDFSKFESKYVFDKIKIDLGI